jgi:hypothetical protein
VSSVGLWICKRSDTRLHLKSYERIDGIVEVPDSVDKFRIAIYLAKVLDIPIQPWHGTNVANASESRNRSFEGSSPLVHIGVFNHSHVRQVPSVLMTTSEDDRSCDHANGSGRCTLAAVRGNVFLVLLRCALAGFKRRLSSSHKLLECMLVAGSGSRVQFADNFAVPRKALHHESQQSDAFGTDSAEREHL